ncbi:restriction endonuclease subunit S [Haemophilus influenzae]|uniref:Type I restriction modification DNA specificity domain protein n=1 Tax=Haemophilus influenzae TaxID=727 RepID=A0AAX3ISU0_HAEIF|nr:restriction endonuclease subunit S [Haemophilus influenzae]RFN94995.1 restriction endonuclease subunit S [Haemophilus influenzae]VTX64096.1 Type I restriction modification DNA specificity domain protein [Haemophilus influenzae]
MKNNRTFLEKLLDGAEVEWKTLDEISSIYGGLTGKGKADFENGNALYVPYKNIFNNIEVDFNNLDTVNVSDDEKQYTIKYGDVLFTGSSETAEEAGMSSAVTTKTEQKIYLNSFSFGLRFNDDIELLPEFSKFLFRTLSIRKEIVKSASGVTRFNISKARFKKIKIPIPPLSVQIEIVKILDALTALTSELTSELILRQKQYEYYREKLLSEEEFGKVGFEWKSLSEVANIANNARKPVKSSLRISGSTPYYGANNIQDYVEGYTHDGEFVLIAEDGSASLENYSIQWAVGKFWANNHVHVVNGKEELNNRFLYHYLTNMNFVPFLAGKERAKLTKAKLQQIPIFVPPLREQHRIVSILDKFETLTNSITEGLPLAIEQSQKRYEYYRELLLNFHNP